MLVVDVDVDVDEASAVGVGTTFDESLVISFVSPLTIALDPLLALAIAGIAVLETQDRSLGELARLKSSSDFCWLLPLLEMFWASTMVPN